MFSGDQIFDALARSQAPSERLRKLDDAGLTRLSELLEKLPDSGVPLLFSVLVSEEMSRRFKNQEARD